MLDLRSKLVKVAWKLHDKFLSDPQATEHTEELAKLLHLAWTLKNVELVNVCRG